MKLGLLSTLCALLFAAPPAEPTEVDFATISDYDYVEGMELPKEVTKYHEEEISISGFMRREDSGTGPVDFFMLINDACGCEGTPKLNEVIFCAMPSGESTEIKPGSVTVTGTIYVEEVLDDDIVVSIYNLDADTVKK